LTLPARLLDHFRRQADDAGKAAIAQLAGDGAEDARAARVLLGIDDDHGVAVKADVAAVVALGRLARADDHALDHVDRLVVSTGQGLLHAGHDDIAQAGITPPGAAQHLDAHAFLGAGVVRDVEVGVLLNHRSLPQAQG